MIYVDSFIVLLENLQDKYPCNCIPRATTSGSEAHSSSIISVATSLPLAAAASLGKSAMSLLSS